MRYGGDDGGSAVFAIRAVQIGIGRSDLAGVGAAQRYAGRNAPEVVVGICDFVGIAVKGDGGCAVVVVVGVGS